MDRNVIQWLILGGALRFYFLHNDLSYVMANRVEISTPLNSLKRVREGIHLMKHGINPYDGDMVHEVPVMLWLLRVLMESLQSWFLSFYALLDILTALILYRVASIFVQRKLKSQKQGKQVYAADSKDLQYQIEDQLDIPKAVLAVYLFNPMALFNCAGLTTTVFSNFLLSVTLYALVAERRLLFLWLAAFETLRNLYPIVLLAPASLIFAKGRLHRIGTLISVFAFICVCLSWLNYSIVRDWNFLDGTLGFIFFYRDLQPNIGLFWYFFTEMFDHFRTMFLITFQMNATILYVVPLTLKLRKEPMLLVTTLLGLVTIFKGYPCIGDVSFYLSLLPLWRRGWKFMAHNFVMFCFFLISLCLMPALWYLWIYAGSANANFYFGATLAFATGQIFLITDLIYAQLKREFCLYNGQKITVDGNDARIILD